MTVPVANEVQSATKPIVDLALLGSSVRNVGRAGSPVRSSRAGGFEDLNFVSIETSE